MTDEAPAETQDTPVDEAPQSEDTPDAPESTQDSTAVDYEQRYSSLQPEYTRATQELSQYKQFVEALTNEETQAQALQALGLSLEDVEADEEPDPNERVARLEEYLNEQADRQAQQEYQQLERQYLDKTISEIEKKESTQFSAEEKGVIERLAAQMPDADGVPDVEAAYAELTKATESRHKRYLESKRSPKLEFGAAGQEKVDLSDPDARANLIAQYAAAAEE